MNQVCSILNKVYSFIRMQKSRQDLPAGFSYLGGLDSDGLLYIFQHTLGNGNDLIF
ncbi:hypothetical protein BN3661_00706 [Eubacteriaceae bacterium CHKCI005]|nr:hypothetical protein BN3661_00706 [Eubacteriaceae bacterium CHKCI005]